MPIRTSSSGVMLMVLMLVLVSRALDAHAYDSESLPSLHGSWIVVEAEHQGRPLREIVGGTLEVIHSDFRLQTASGKSFAGRLRMLPASTPLALDFEHTEGELKGQKWLAIYVRYNDRLLINYNYVDATMGHREQHFKTAGATEATLVILKRVRQ